MTRVLHHGIAPRKTNCCHHYEELCLMSDRGRALIDIEFLMLNPCRTCVITSPPLHACALAFLFPHTEFRIYNSHQTRNHNLIHIPEPFNDNQVIQEPFTLIFTDESDDRQLACNCRRNPEATLFACKSLPVHHMQGLLFIPMYSPRGSTALFIHKHRSTGMKAQQYDPLLLVQELRAASINDNLSEHLILRGAVHAKILGGGGTSDPTVVDIVQMMIQTLLLPPG